MDVRFAVDNDGELYVLTKSDGMIRKVVGARAATAPAPTVNAPSPAWAERHRSASTRVPRIPWHPHQNRSSWEAGLRCQLRRLSREPGSGRSQSRMTISIIEEQRGKQPPDLTDDQWDHRLSDAEIFSVIKRGVPPAMMPGLRWAHYADDEIWGSSITSEAYDQWVSVGVRSARVQPANNFPGHPSRVARPLRPVNLGPREQVAVEQHAADKSASRRFRVPPLPPPSSTRGNAPRTTRADREQWRAPGAPHR